MGIAFITIEPKSQEVLDVKREVVSEEFAHGGTSRTEMHGMEQTIP